jgi:hypothetical protein
MTKKVIITNRAEETTMNKIEIDITKKVIKDIIRDISSNTFCKRDKLREEIKNRLKKQIKTKKFKIVEEKKDKVKKEKNKETNIY